MYLCFLIALINPGLKNQHHYFLPLKVKAGCSRAPSLSSHHSMGRVCLNIVLSGVGVLSLGNSFAWTLHNQIMNGSW